MKTALEMKKATQTYERAAEEQVHKLITSWIEYQVADVINMAVISRKFTAYILIPTTMTGHNDYIRSYLEDFGYQVQFSSERVYISWEDAE